MQRCLLPAVVVLIVVARQSPAAAQQWGDLTGKVVIRFNGPPPVPALLNLPGGGQIADESLLMAADGGLANVVLYVRTPNVPIHPDLAAGMPQFVNLTLRNDVLRPRIAPLWIGKQTAQFENLDPFACNPSLQPLGDQGKNFLLPPGGVETYNPARQQNIPVPISCNIKSWICAFLLPRQNPYVAVSDAKGEFRIPKLPVQALEFQLWHEKYGYLDTPQQPMGRFMMNVTPGENDLGTIVAQRE